MDQEGPRLGAATESSQVTVVNPREDEGSNMTTVLNPAKTAAARVVLPNVSRETYERLLTTFPCSVPHLTYDQGRLEVMGPTAKHEKVNRGVVDFW